MSSPVIPRNQCAHWWRGNLSPNPSGWGIRIATSLRSSQWQGK